MVKGLPASAGNVKTCGFDPWARKMPWRRNGNLLQCPCLEKIPWTEERGRLQSRGSERVGHT